MTEVNSPRSASPKSHKHFWIPLLGGLLIVAIVATTFFMQGNKVSAASGSMPTVSGQGIQVQSQGALTKISVETNLANAAFGGNGLTAHSVTGLGKATSAATYDPKSKMLVDTISLGSQANYTFKLDQKAIDQILQQYRTSAKTSPVALKAHDETGDSSDTTTAHDWIFQDGYTHAKSINTVQPNSAWDLKVHEISLSLADLTSPDKLFKEETLHVVACASNTGNLQNYVDQVNQLRQGELAFAISTLAGFTFKAIWHFVGPFIIKFVAKAVLGAVLGALLTPVISYILSVAGSIGAIYTIYKVAKTVKWAFDTQNNVVAAFHRLD